MDPDVFSCWARDDAVRPRYTRIDEVHGMYREEFGLETSLLEPFFRNSRRPVSERFKLYIDELNGKGCDSWKDSDYLEEGVRKPWWKKTFFWKTDSW